MSKGKVLFFYPNNEGYPGIPTTIALLSGCLNEAGFETRCFDTTFLASPYLNHVERQKYGGVVKSDAGTIYPDWKPELAEKTPELLRSEIEAFKPDMIAVSFLENAYRYGISVLNEVMEKAGRGVPVVAGGIFVTMNPELVISEACIDYICVGEGEETIVELAGCISNGKDCRGIRNLWGKDFRNPKRPLKDLDALPFQDWSIFDALQVYKPYCGDFLKSNTFEITRGCYFNCTYCCTSSLRRQYRDMGQFVRRRSIDRAVDEIEHLMKAYDLELIFITDDDFLNMPPAMFDQFCVQYASRINLPLVIQTRCENIREDRIRKLKEVNVSTIGLGVEHGNEAYRKKYLNRNMSNESLREAFDLIHRYDIRTTANVIMGCPMKPKQYSRTP